MTDELDDLFNELEKEEPAKEIKEPKKAKTQPKIHPARIAELTGEIIQTLVDKGEPMTFKDLHKTLPTGISEDELTDILTDMLTEGVIFEPKADHFKAIDGAYEPPKPDTAKKEVKTEEPSPSSDDDDLAELGLSDMLEDTTVPEKSTVSTETQAIQPIGDVPAPFVVTIDNIPKQLLINLHGEPYITKAGLLWLGKKAGVKGINTEAVINTWENDKKMAKYRATVFMRDGGYYTSDGIAIADGKNVTMRSMYAFIDHLAETRAVNRALRMATNCGFVSAEEVPSYEKESD